MDQDGSESPAKGECDEAELRQLLMELQQLTKQQTSYTTVLQSLGERQSVINDMLLQTVDYHHTWKKLKDSSLLERDNQLLRQKMYELTKSERLFDARMTDLKSKLSESAASSKKLLQSKQQALKYVDDLKAKLDAGKLELDRVRASAEELTTEKCRLQRRVGELTADAAKVAVLLKETAEFREKIASMERLQALRSLRELEDTSANEETEKLRLELIEETTEINEGIKHSDHTVKLKAIYAELATCFNAVSAASWMFQHSALTLKELQSIQSLRDRPVEAAETLLNIIIEQPDAVYDSFLDALKHSNQKHVYQWIVYDVDKCDGDSSNTERIREHYLFLVDNVDLKFYQLLDRLYCDGVVDLRDLEEITSQPTNRRQNEKLLCLLSHKSTEQFQIFLENLDRSGQSHIRNTVDNRQECEPVTVDDRLSDLDNEFISQRYHEQQQQQLKLQLKQACDRELSATCQLETANKTIQDLQEHLENRMDTIQGLRCELEKAQQKETELQLQMQNADTGAEGRPVSVAWPEIKAPVGDMLFAFLSYTLREKQQSLLVDSLMARNVITAREVGEIQKLTTVEEKALMLLSWLKRMSTNDVEQWVTTISSVGQMQLTEAKLRTFSPRVTHSVPMLGVIQGVTRLSSRLYVLLSSDADQIQVYTTDCEYRYIQNISVAELSATGVCDIASCEENNCLYLSNMDKNCIHVIVPKASSSKISKWPLSDTPVGLSVMRTGRLLVTCTASGRLLELNHRGKTIRTIILDSDVRNPLHSIQLACGDYVLCCCGDKEGLHRVCIVNQEGRVERSYGSTSGAAERQLSWPTHLALDRDGFVFVADRNNARIVLLSPSLEFVSLVLPNELQRRTNHVYIDDAANKLYASSRVFDQRRSLVTAVQLSCSPETGSPARLEF